LLSRTPASKEIAVSRSVTRSSFPTCPAELTAPWVTASLRGAGILDDDDAVIGFSVESVGAGVGIMGEIVRLTLDYENPGRRPLDTVIAKFATSVAENKAVAAGFAMYEREARFYSDLAPLVGDVAPICYHVDYQSETNDMVIMFEDLADYLSGDQEAGISLHDARLALAAVAKLHAKTWGADTDERYQSWPRVDGPIYLNGFGAGVAAGLEPALATFGSVIPTEVSDAASRIREAIPDLHAGMARGPQALIHGDFRFNNFMFGTSAEHRPFVMLDFQAPMISKPVHDVAYLLTQSMAIDLRREHETALLEGYLAALAAEGITDYDFEQCWDDYRLAALHCFEYAVVIAGTLDPSSDVGRGWIAELFRRSSQSIVDLDLLALLP
jgi:hypothetical protein